MRRTVIFIEQIVNNDESCQMTISGEQNGHYIFSEEFKLESKDDYLNLLPIVNDDIGNNTKRFSVSIIRKLLSVLITSIKVSGVFSLNDKQRNVKFQLIGMNTIKQFERLANIRLDDSKFSTLNEFQSYMKSIIVKQST